MVVPIIPHASVIEFRVFIFVNVGLIQREIMNGGREENRNKILEKKSKSTG